MKNFNSIGQPVIVVRGGGGASLWLLHKYNSGAGCKVRSEAGKESEIDTKKYKKYDFKKF